VKPLTKTEVAVTSAVVLMPIWIVPLVAVLRRVLG
jgi:hypothetical protein